MIHAHSLLVKRHVSYNKRHLCKSGLYLCNKKTLTLNVLNANLLKYVKYFKFL